MYNENGYLFRKDKNIIRAIWTIDSETGIEYLIDLDSSKVIAKRVDGKLTDPEEALF